MHGRRYFYDARDSAPGLAQTALAWIGQLYAIEKRAKDLEPHERKALRKDEAKPILRTFGKWLKQQRDRVLPKDPIGKAVNYALSNWRALNRYVYDGELSIDNGASERDISAIRANQSGFDAATIDNPYDIDRSGRVDLGDLIQARNHRSMIDVLELINVPTASQLASPSPSPRLAAGEATRPLSSFPAPSSLHASILDSDALLTRMRTHATAFGVDALLDEDEDEDEARSPLLASAQAAVQIL